MYARLWWKDLRQFWPIWAFLLFAAMATQAIVLHYAGSDAKSGALPPLALSFAWLYAVAVGAAAFAGERENGTLRFLDTLPVDRFLLWRGKVSFALVTTLALAVLVVIPAIWTTEHWDPNSKDAFSWLPLAYLVLLVEALGWGLLISALSRTALTAALGAACCGAASLGIVLMDMNQSHAELLIKSIPLRLVAIAATMAISAWMLIREGKGVRFRAEGRPRSRGKRAIDQTLASLRSPVVIRSPIARDAAAVATQPPRLWARWPEIRSMIWLTCHQGWRPWALLIAFVMGVPVLWFLTVAQNGVALSSSDAFFFMLVVGALAISAGINVFGSENRGRTYRFLTNHGARPGLVWGSKQLTWVLALPGLLATIPSILSLNGPFLAGADASTALGMLGLWTYPFPVALMCGMVFRRGITAWVVSLIVLAGVLIPIIAMLTANLISPYATLVPPLAMVFLTWAWRRDWMLDRPAPGRWIRLGTWTVGTLAVLFAWHVSNRAWGIPDRGSLTPPSAWRAPAIPDDRNAAKLYEEIQRKGFKFVNINQIMPLDAWNVPLPDDPLLKFLEANAEIYPLVRKAASLPDCRFGTDPSKRTGFSVPIYIPLDLYARLLAVHAGVLGRKGDLAGAWDDIEALFRMAQQQTQDAVSWYHLRGLEIEGGALALAMQWATEPKQTPERLRAALSAYRNLPAMTPITDIIRGEAAIMEQTFALPRDEFRVKFFERFSDPKRRPSTWEAVGIDASTTPWEIERARRVNRARFSEAIDLVLHEPARRSNARARFLAWQAPPNMREALMISHLVPYLWSIVERNDLNEVGRRALVQILALRIWQLEHDGKLPESLDDLVPGLLPKLPTDPYSREQQPFRYIGSDGRGVPALGTGLSDPWRAASVKVIGTKGYRLLYSIGLNQHDNGGAFMQNLPGSSENDIVFPLKDDVGKMDVGSIPKP